MRISSSRKGQVFSPKKGTWKAPAVEVDMSERVEKVSQKVTKWTGAADDDEDIKEKVDKDFPIFFRVGSPTRTTKSPNRRFFRKAKFRYETVSDLGTDMRFFRCITYFICRICIYNSIYLYRWIMRGANQKNGLKQLF